MKKPIIVGAALFALLATSMPVATAGGPRLRVGIDCSLGVQLFNFNDFEAVNDVTVVIWEIHSGGSDARVLGPYSLDPGEGVDIPLPEDDVGAYWTARAETESGPVGSVGPTPCPDPIPLGVSLTCDGIGVDASELTVGHEVALDWNATWSDEQAFANDVRWMVDAGEVSLTPLESLAPQAPPGASWTLRLRLTGWGTNNWKRWSAEGECPVLKAPRTITLRISNALVARGVVKQPNGHTACIDGVPVRIERKRPGGGWRPAVMTGTDQTGHFKRTLPKKGVYRSVAPKIPLHSWDSCRRAVSPRVVKN
jgi:hypothetical protein